MSGSFLPSLWSSKQPQSTRVKEPTLLCNHNHSTLPRQYTELDRCFMCRRCGAVLTQPTLAVQPGNEGVLSTSPSPDKFTRYYFEGVAAQRNLEETCTALNSQN